MNIQQLIRLITRLCELERVDEATQSIWVCGNHKFTAPLARDRIHPQRYWAIDGVPICSLSWAELMRIGGYIADCIM